MRNTKHVIYLKNFISPFINFVEWCFLPVVVNIFHFLPRMNSLWCLLVYFSSKEKESQCKSLLTEWREMRSDVYIQAQSCLAFSFTLQRAPIDFIFFSSFFHIAVALYHFSHNESFLFFEWCEMNERFSFSFINFFFLWKIRKFLFALSILLSFSAFTSASFVIFVSIFFLTWKHVQSHRDNS